MIKESPNVTLDNSFTRFGWQRLDLQGKLYIKGHLTNMSVNELDKILSEIITSKAEGLALHKKLECIWGHFAFIYFFNGTCIMAVDKIRSIPIYYYNTQGHYTLGAEAEVLVQKMPQKAIDHKALMTFRMSGYTIGDRSLVAALKSLRAGEYIVINSETESRGKYYSYVPMVIEDSRENLEKNLREKTLEIFDRTVKSLNGRPIVVPISGGFDSRLVASALKEVGATNVHCLSYGRPGNFDAETGKKVAKALGLKWEFYPLDLKNQTTYFRSDKFKKYLKFADSYLSVPFYQDNFVINQLAEKNIFPKHEAVFMNGNSGDYISGGHLPLSFQHINKATDVKDLFYSSYIKKHCSLWKNLITEENTSMLKKLIDEELKEINIPLTHTSAPALIEYLELINRQSKFVVSGQRSYEYFDYDWRLPLWEDEYLYFWQNVPAEYKYGQNLYKGMLLNANWGGVWKNIPLNLKYINPSWMKPVRLAFKTLYLPFGKEKWYDFEKRYLAYYMEPLGLYSMWPYKKISSDKRGPRNIVSWRSEQYLIDKGYLL